MKKNNRQLMDEKDLSRKLGISINKSLWKRIVSYYQRTYAGVVSAVYPNIDLFAYHRVLSAKTELERLRTLLPTPNKKDKFLDSGCGLGVFVTLALKHGYNFYGYEIDEELISIAKDLLTENYLPSNHIFTYKEFLSMEPHEFFMITSFEVAEHVQDTDLYIKEQAQALSAGGKLFIETPNYIIPYEPHFYTLLPPGPRFIKWFICRLQGKTNKIFFNELNFITPWKLKKAFNKAGLKAINMGRAEWIDTFVSSKLENRSNYVIGLNTLVRKLHLTFLIKALTRLGIYTPLVYICEL